MSGRAVRFLEELVTVSSPSGEEETAVRMLVREMAALGLAATIDRAGNAVGVREVPDADGRSPTEILLLGHIDTVPGAIEVRVEDGKLFGRGTVDAKGPLVTFLFAAARAAIQPGTRLVVIGAVEEESATSKGARQAVVDFNPEYCIIGEPSGFDSVTLGYKGRLLIDYILRQPMAHSAGPEVSVSEKVFTWWKALSDYTDRHNAAKIRLFEQIHPSIRSIHTSSDGLSDTVQAQFGIRVPPDFDPELFQTEAKSWAGEAVLSFHGYEPAFRSERGSFLATVFRQVLRENEIRPRSKMKTGTSDMNVVGPIWNCPIVAYGPGDSRLDHTPQEHIDLLEFRRAVALLSEVLARLSRSGPGAAPGSPAA